MKVNQLLPLLFVGILFSSTLTAQKTIEISGTVHSPRGVEPRIDVEILNANGDFVTRALTGADGQFKTTRKFTINSSIQIRIKDKAFMVFEKAVRVPTNGNIGDLQLERKQIALSGFVKDSLAGKPIENAQVSFYEDSKLIQSKSTNNQGYFDIETDYAYGQKITIRVDKKGYYSKEQTKTVTSDGINSFDDFLLPCLGCRVSNVFIKVFDKKTDKPLSNVAVRYYDNRTMSKVTIVTPLNGEVVIKAYLTPGTLLDLEIVKAKYKTLSVKAPIQIDFNNKNEFKYYMESARKPLLCPCLLIGSGVAALVSGGMFLSSDKKYEAYKNFSNENRETDFTQAQTRARIGTVASGVAGGALVGWIICKIRQKNKDEQERRVSGSSYLGYSPSRTVEPKASNGQIGLTMSF